MGTVASPKPVTLSPWLRLLLGLLLSGLTAVLLTLAMPPYGLWPLAFVGFVPMLLAQYRLLPPRLSSLGFAAGIGGFIGFYLLDTFFTFTRIAWYMQALPLIFAVILFLTELGDRKLHDRTGYRWFVLAGALGWVGVEMIRSLIPVLGTWGFIAYSFYQVPWLIQPVSIFGVFGMSLVAVLGGFALGLVALAFFDRRWRLEDAVVPVAPALAWRWLKIALAAFAGWALLSLALWALPAGPEVTVAAVQPNFMGLETPAERQSGISLARYNEIQPVYEQRLWEQSRQAASQGAQLIVWPEGALSGDPQAGKSEALTALANETGAVLVVPYGVRSSFGLRNEATVLTPQGQFLGVYGKDHPVTFLGETSLTRGSYPVYPTGLGTLGTIICYDLDFTDTARKIARAGAQLIAAPSGDWPQIAGKHYAHLIFRAVENRVAMIKVDHSYASAIIDPHGRVRSLAVSSTGEQATLVAKVPLGTGRAPQVFLGDWLGWLSLAGLAFFALPNPLLKN